MASPRLIKEAGARSQEPESVLCERPKWGRYLDMSAARDKIVKMMRHIISNRAYIIQASGSRLLKLTFTG
jgi:hypothetical protein